VAEESLEAKRVLTARCSELQAQRDEVGTGVSVSGRGAGVQQGGERVWLWRRQNGG
jgi:hypothetical protein